MVKRTWEPVVATDEHVPAMTALINRAFQVEAPFVRGDRIDEAEMRGLMLGGRFLLLEDGGVPFANIYVQLRGERGYFGLLAVHPDYQGQGAGLALIATAEAFCLRHGCRYMDILVVNLREDLQPFYRKLGYVETAIVPFKRADRALKECHSIVMTKQLSALPQAAVSG